MNFLSKNVTPLIGGLGRIGGTKIKTPKGSMYLKKTGTEWQDVKVIRSMYDLGINFFDTAELYGWGYGEYLLGEALKNKPRDSFVVATKIFRIEEEDIKEAVIKKGRDMLDRLGTSYVDVLYLHEPYEPMEDYIEGLLKLSMRGLIRSIGFSRFSLEQLKKAERILGRYWTLISIVQSSFSIAERRFLPEELLKYCRHKQIHVAGFRPLLNVLQNSTIKQKLSKLTEKYNATPAQIAISWVRSRNIIPIVRSHNVSHIKENIEALNIKLERKDIAILDRLV